MPSLADLLRNDPWGAPPQTPLAKTVTDVGFDPSLGFAGAVQTYLSRLKKMQGGLAQDMLDTASDPNAEGIQRAANLLGGLGLKVANPIMAIMPSAQELRDRGYEAGASPEVQAVGGALGDMVNIPEPASVGTLLAGLAKTVGTAKAAASVASPLLHSMAVAPGKGRGLAELLADASPAEQAALKARLEAEAAQTGGQASSVSREQALNGLTGGGNVPPVKSAAQSPVDEYAMSHRPPMSNSGAPLHDVTGGGDYYPDDVYSHKAVQYYGTGNDAMDHQTISLVHQMRGKPNATVTIYRAVPHTATKEEQIFKLEQDMKKYMARGTVPQGATKTGSDWYNAAWNDLQGLKSLPDKVPENVQINPGDWVTINRAYAKDHGESSLRGGYKIISKKVKAKDIFTNGDSIHEWGYDPK